MKKFFGYVRVSTAKQGEHGVSLQEQRDAIIRFAERNGLTIVAWFEERETAAKRGRPTFNEMLKLLRQGKADGAIIHKIDRSARNLRDWADLGELIDRGIEVQFANESLDLQTRGGRLSADIQAVVAADYIRNLREETRKGFYGRIKQGLFPLPAPLGYTDQGKGKPKELDPTTAPFVRKAFELYASGRYTLHNLVEEMYRMRLRNKRGGKVALNRLSDIFNNPFYVGLIRIKRTGETFPGVHQPLLPVSLFKRVHQVLKGKTNARVQRHDFFLRRLITCKGCGYSLIGERQKGHIYYRCHTRGCPPTCVREDMAEAEIQRIIAPLEFSAEEKKYAEQKVARLGEELRDEKESITTALNLRLGNLQTRFAKLTDAYLDGLIEKNIFEERKTVLLLERKSIEEHLAHVREKEQTVLDQVARFLELAGNANLLYELGITEEKRDLLKTLTSNRQAEGKKLYFTLYLPFQAVANRFKIANSAPHRDIPRTMDTLIEKLATYFKQNPAPIFSMQSEDS